MNAYVLYVVMASVVFLLVAVIFFLAAAGLPKRAIRWLIMRLKPRGDGQHDPSLHHTARPRRERTDDG